MTSHTPDRSREAGNALLLTLLVIAVLFVLGSAFVVVSVAGYRSASAHAASTSALYVADAGFQQIVGKQNDSTQNPRFIFNPTTYQSSGANPYFVDFDVKDPSTGVSVGKVTRKIVNNKDPLTDAPPYRVAATSSVRGAVRKLEADIAPRSLLEYAVWSEGTVNVASNITISGKMYSASTINLTGSPITFLKDVEYVTSLTNQNYGTYYGQIVDLAAAYPTLTTLVDLNNFELSGKEGGHCGAAAGLYIGGDAGAMNNALFTRSAGVYQIDLTLFDLSGPTKSPAQAVTYNGTALKRFSDGAPLTAFSGVIFVEGELHIWGMLGGRSVEDATVLDKSKPAGPAWYAGPNGSGMNLYSNNELDSGEDGSGGGTVNGGLDPRKLGQNLTIVTGTGQDIVIEHNIFMGYSPAGAPVRMALISGDAIYVAANSPKTIVIEAALLARGEDGGISWQPLGDATTHQDNYWAKAPDGSYVYDLDNDGTLESNNGASVAGDRNENSMLSAWALIERGNLVTAGTPVSGIWASASHLRNYAYDPTLVTSEPPCYPVLALYQVVPGTWHEVY